MALVSEAKALTSHTAKPGSVTSPGDGTALCISGMGLDAARRAAQQLVTSGVTALAMFGVAGALDHSLRNGTLFCPDHVVDEQGRSYATDTAWRASVQQHCVSIAQTTQFDGRLLSVSSPLLTAASKHAAHERYASLAVDMESAAVAAVAAEHGLPFMALRAIVDEVDDGVPAALNGSIDAWGRPRLLALLVALCRHPALLADLPRLHSRMQQATRTLHDAAHATGPVLGWRHDLHHPSSSLAS